MASHTEIAPVSANGQTANGKARKTTKANVSRTKSSSRPSKKETRQEKANTENAPVMKLRAIDILDEDNSKHHGNRRSAADAPELPDVMETPPPMPDGGVVSNSHAVTGGSDDEGVVSDPELIELLQQLTATIDTANTVLEAASVAPGDAGGMESNQMNLQQYERLGTLRPTQPQDPDPGDEELPPLAEQHLSMQKAAGRGQKQRSFGFGLVVNSAMTGLVLAAGAAWLVHTNPWLLDGPNKDGLTQEVVPGSAKASKDQASLTRPGELAKPTLPEAKPQRAQPKVAPEAAPAETRASVTTATTAAPEATPPARVRPAENLRYTGEPGASIKLNIPMQADQSNLGRSIMIQGVPNGATLTQGRNLGAGNWLLTEDQLGGLELKTSATIKPGDYNLDVISVKSDGSVPETRKMVILLEPQARPAQTQKPLQANVAPSAPTTPAAPKTGDAAAAATAVPEKAPAPVEQALPALSPQEVQALLARGKARLEEGDVAGARLLYEYAAQRGNKEAMLGLGKSYDPQYLSKLNVHGVRPDAKKSAEWYERAAKAGTSNQ